MVFMLGGAWLARVTFDERVQRPHCFAYAEAKGLPDRAFLEFVDVTLTTGQRHIHECHFRDTRTQVPVTLAFDEADIPVRLDTLEVVLMCVPAVIAIIIGAMLTPKLTPA